MDLIELVHQNNRDIEFHSVCKHNRTDTTVPPIDGFGLQVNGMNHSIFEWSLEEHTYRVLLRYKARQTVLTCRLTATRISLLGVIVIRFSPLATNRSAN